MAEPSWRLSVEHGCEPVSIVNAALHKPRYLRQDARLATVTGLRRWFGRQDAASLRELGYE